MAVLSLLSSSWTKRRRNYTVVKNSVRRLFSFGHRRRFGPGTIFVNLARNYRRLISIELLFGRDVSFEQVPLETIDRIVVLFPTTQFRQAAT